MAIITDWSGVKTDNLRRKVKKLLDRSFTDGDERMHALELLGKRPNAIPNVDDLVKKATREQLEAAATTLSYLIGPSTEVGKGTTIEQDALTEWEQILANCPDQVPPEWREVVDQMIQPDNIGFKEGQVNPVMRIGKIFVYEEVLRRCGLPKDEYVRLLGDFLEVSREEFERTRKREKTDEVVEALRVFFSYAQDRTQQMPTARQMLLAYAMLG